MTLQRFAPLALLLAACGEGAPATAAPATLTDEAIASLPALTVSPGALVCTSIGADGCPLRGAVANRIGDDRIAIWEPGFTVYLFGPGDTLGTPIGLAGPEGQYGYAVAATRAGNNRYRLLVADGTWRAIEIGADGTISRTDTLPDPGILTVIGYVGERLIRQRMAGWLGDSGGQFVVTELRRLDDTTGTPLLEAPLPWLRGGNQNGPPVPPLVASTPSWALTTEGDLVWSPGDRLVIERRSRAGRVRWRVEGGAGPRVTEADLAARDSAVRQGAAMLPFTEEHFAEMRAKSDSFLPAVSGLTTTPTGEVIVARTLFPTRDSVEYLRLGADGVPNGRFTLDRRIKVLLAERDSLLVHTPTEGEPWEVRWIRLMTEN